MPANALRDMLRRASLTAVSRTAKRIPKGTLGDRDFLRYQIETLENVFSGVRIDFCAVSTMLLDTDLKPKGFDCSLLNIHTSMIDNYDVVAAYDDLSPVVHLNPGRVVRHDFVFDQQSWQASPLFLKHCRLYDIHRLMRIAFQYPSMDRKVISFDYLGADDNKTWEELDLRLLEIATFPFALSWLFRKGAIDETRYNRYIERLSDLTPNQILYLRKFVNSPWQDLATQAKELGYSHGGYKQTLYSIRDAIIDKLSLPENGFLSQKSTSLRIIDHDYAFLRMLGDPTAPLIRKVS